MKKKFGISLGSAILLAAVCVGMVFAFSYVWTDGVWGQIDSTGAPAEINATCNNWGRVTNSSYMIGDVIGVIYNRAYGPGGEDETYTRYSTICAGDPDGDGTFAEWDRTGSAVWTGLGSYTGCTTASGIFISEYVYDQRDNDNNDRLAIEIYNGTGAAFARAGWSLLLFTSDKDFRIVTLTAGDIAAGDVWVVVNEDAADRTGQEDQTIPDDANYNNDLYRTVVLIKNYAAPVVGAVDTDGWSESVQDYSTTDENQVRYGMPPNTFGCPGIQGFVNQSGFGFEGIEAAESTLDPAENQPFAIGRFCHYNSPILVAANAFEGVPLYLDVNGITCPAGSYLDPNTPTLNFEYLVTLDETTNDLEPCEYGETSPSWPGGNSYPLVSGDTGPNRNGCADMVNFENVVTTTSFVCRYDASHAQDYTVSILGFTPSIAGTACPATPTGTLQFNRIYTAEAAKNCFCVYAAFTEGQITPIVLKYLSAEAVENGILVSWETATEVNNLGFNVYRAELVDGERVKLNPELIMSKVGPGGMTGATYEFLDETTAVGVTYYYWLEDVPLEAGVTPGIYGPISAVR